VRFYEGERSLAQVIAQFFADGFADGHPAIIVATPSIRAALLLELDARAFNVVDLQRSRMLLLFDVRDMLSIIASDGKPDAVIFDKIMCGAIDRACRDRPDRATRIFGQMVDVLWRDGQQKAAIALEILWNQLARKRGFWLLCGYATGNVYEGSSVGDICGQHSHVVLADGTLKRVKPQVLDC
jgi:hypothetical protein